MCGKDDLHRLGEERAAENGGGEEGGRRQAKAPVRMVGLSAVYHAAWADG